ARSRARIDDLHAAGADLVALPCVESAGTARRLPVLALHRGILALVRIPGIEAVQVVDESEDAFGRCLDACAAFDGEAVRTSGCINHQQRQEREPAEQGDFDDHWFLSDCWCTGCDVSAPGSSRAGESAR